MKVTLRSIILGVLLMPINSMWLISMEMIWLSGQPSTLSLMYNVVWFITVIIAFNLVIERWRPAWALTAGEILVVYTMLSIATAISSIDCRNVLLPMMTTATYYRDVTGMFTESSQYVPEWLLLTDSHALRSYYLGQESWADPANLLPWIKPLAAWSLFIFALCAVMGGILLVLRKQWTENEKLAYPVIQLPMHLATDTWSLIRNRVFWIAFGLAAAIDVMNGVNAIFPLMPKLPLVRILDIQTLFTERPWTAMGSVPVSLYPFAIGMCFFMPLDLAFSCWFFFIFWKLQRVWASHVGINGMPGFPFVEEQTAGGYYALAVLALWVSRQHLLRYLRVLFGSKDQDITVEERREARLAAALIIGGLMFLMGFCVQAGMSWGTTAVFFILYYFLTLGITRMRAELGHPSHDLHYIGPNIHIIKFLGAPWMKENRPKDLAMLGFFWWFNRAYRGHPMPHGLEGFRIAERLKMGHRGMAWAMAIAVVAGTISAFWGALAVMNYYGALQITACSDGMGMEAWNTVNTRFVAPEPHQYAPALAILFGLFVSFGLGFMRMAATWWPFHPVGFAVSGSWSMEQLWVSFLAAWVIKALLMKYGGARAYKASIPFFLGLMMGDFMAGGFWNLYGAIAGVEVYHFWPY